MADDSHNQFVALLVAIAGGWFMGLYPLFIKTKPVLAANVHPVVFQLYKSTIVFITSWILLIPRAMRTLPEGEPLFEFTIWGVVSAAFWVPSGLLTIASVPMIGMGMQVAINCAANALLSFLVFWLVFGSEMKQYPCGEGCTYYRAPIYLTGTLIGMVALIFSDKIATKLGFEAKRPDAILPSEKQPFLNKVGSVNSAPAKNPQGGIGTWVLGFILSVFCGVFAAAQYAVLNPAQKSTLSSFNCGKKENSTSSVKCKQIFESFDHFGSWLVSFGIGAVLVTLVLLVIVCIQRRMTGTTPEARAPPDLHWDVLKFSGVGAGCCWALANFLITTANVIGGNAVVMPSVLSAQIISSGFWGMCWYGESGGAGAKAVWVVCAVFTLVSMILLGFEKISDSTTVSPAGGGSGSGAGLFDEGWDAKGWW